MCSTIRLKRSKPILMSCARRARSRNSNVSTSASCAASACTRRTACSTAGRNIISSWAWSRACRRIPICLPILQKLIVAASPWQVTAVGRAEDLAAAPARRGIGRTFAHRSRRHVLLARRQQSRLERRAGGNAGALRARSRPRGRKPGRGARSDGPLTYSWSTIFSENRSPLFRITL